MRKNAIKNILSIKDNSNKLSALNSIKTTRSNTRDMVNEILWWVITKRDLKKLKNFWLKKEIQDKKTRKICKKIWIKLIRVLSSISSWNIRNNIEQKLKNPWVALEFFLLDKLIREKIWSSSIRYEKWAEEFDQEKIDFLSTYTLNDKKIIIWNQLTTTKSKRIKNKVVEVERVRDKIDSKEWIVSKNDFSITQIPDLVSLFIINSKTSEILNSWEYKNNILKQAYIRWKEEWFKKWWPSKYLDKEIENELKTISKIYSEILDWFVEFITNKKLDKNIKTTIKNRNIWEMSINYDSIESQYKVLFYKINKNEKKFIFSISFYITNKLLKKVWREETLESIKRKKDNTIKKPNKTRKRGYKRKK